MSRVSRIFFLGLLLATVFAQAWSEEDGVCHVGAQLHLQKGVPEETYLRHLRAFVEADMADYVLLLDYSLDRNDRERVAHYLKEQGVHFLVQESFKAGEWRHERGDFERYQAIAGDLFLGIHWGEMDTMGLKPEGYLPKVVYENPTRPKVKEALAGRVKALMGDVHQTLGVQAGHSSAALYHPLFAEAGVDIICSEVGENIPNVNMMLASNRGTARAYGKRWMIDHSTWWSPRGNVGKQVSPREGHTPWCFFTSLLGAAMGGADFVQLEVDWAAYPEESLFHAGNEAPGPLLPWGRALKSLYSVTRRIGPRGETMTPVAILMGHENGWPGVGWRVGDVRATGLFDGIRHTFMQTRDADLSLKTLDVFYPGFERCAWDPEYPGFLAESPLGTLDMVPDNLAAEKYTRYKALVALGYHRMTPSIQETLKTYVENGGILVCSDTLFLDEHENLMPADVAEPLIGCLLDALDDNVMHFDRPATELDAIEGYAAAGRREEWQDHWIHSVKLTSGRVVARMNDAPYIIENRRGAGRVFFVTALNMVGSDGQRRGPEPFLYSNMLYYFLHTLEDHIGDGLEFAPWTSLEHIYNKKSDGSAMLLVMNHGDMDYRRDATLRNPDGFTCGRIAARGTWEGWSEGAVIDFDKTGETLAWSFSIPPKSFVLFELTP
ncbi:MAG TPA: beta-galactosidase trimerization domain-containing protein [Candidatus Bathyarchaeia archaeon]|nr:beta-galactosidase trimerization domain-containing protein [Candidatus Bathyarchaeia archaeon]